MWILAFLPLFGFCLFGFCATELIRRDNERERVRQHEERILLHEERMITKNAHD